MRKTKTKADRKSAYLLEFSDGVAARVPAFAGRIEWDTALHYFFTGVPVAEAVERYISLKACPG